MALIGCPNCCSTPTCEIGSDDFDRADDTDVGGDWIEESGDFEIYDGTLVTSTDGSRAIHQTPAASGTIALRAECRAKGEFDTDVARLIIKWKDASNFWYLEVPFGASKTLAIKKRIAGVTSTVSSSTITTALGEWYSLSVCYGGGHVTGGVVGIDGLDATHSTTINDQLYAGVSASVDGAVSFDDFRHYYSFSDDRASCDPCEPPGGPDDCLSCCDDATESAADFDLVVDIGSPGFGRQTCDPVTGPRVDCANGECEAIGGEYTLSAYGFGSCLEAFPGGSPCPTWIYSDQFCSSSTPGNTGCIDNFGAQLCLSAVLQFDAILGKCTWEVLLLIGDSFLANFYSVGYYRTPAGDPLAGPCSGDTIWTLNLEDANYSTVRACTGNLPATITIRRA